MPQKNIKTSRSLPKIARKAGSVHLEWKRCGRPNCHCAKGGIPHGPYAAHYWREGGIQKKRYVRMAHITDVLSSIQERKDERADLAEVKRTLKAFKGLGGNR